MADISAIKLPNGTTYDLKDKRQGSIFFGVVDNTSTATAFTATIDGITEYHDGLAVLLKNGVITSASGFTININGLGAKHAYSNMAAATAETTLFNINYTMLFVYDSTRVEGGGWILYRGYNSNDNTIGYQVRTNSSSLPMKSVTYRYRLLFTSADGQGFVPATNSTSTNATASRTVCQDKINPFGRIVYYGTTTSVAAGSRPGATYLWEQYVLSLGYSFNKTGAALTLTSWKPVYVKCNPQSDGSIIIDPDIPYVQDLPATDDGKVYIFLGIAYSDTNIELFLEHPIYHYKNGRIRIWNGNTSTEELFNLVDGSSTGSVRGISTASENSSYTIGSNAFAEGYSTKASGDNSHAEGYITTASGTNSHAEGYSTTASKSNSHAEGASTRANGENSHAEGCATEAYGNYSHAEGYNTSSNYYAHAEGAGTAASGYYAHAEGVGTTASADNSHAEGGGTTASNNQAHAEGGGTTASGINSHAEGFSTVASGETSHSQNEGTKAAKAAQTVIGTYNIEDTDSFPIHPSAKGKYGTFAFIIGNGTADNARSNALDVSWDGTLRTSGNITDGSGNVLSNKVNTSSLATVATSGSYNDLTNKPTIPTVNNATLTIQKNGTNVNTFTANASSNVTANITVPTKTSDLTNDSGFITSYTETDPVFSASPAHSITTNQIQNWSASSTIHYDTSVDPTEGEIISIFERTNEDGIHGLVIHTDDGSMDGKPFFLPDLEGFGTAAGQIIQLISTKADQATTLSGYGITDAKITSGTITLGSNTITPVTSVAAANATDGGLTISGSPITSSGTINIGHSNVLSSAQTTQAVYPIKIDKNGHISAYGSAVTIPTIPSNIVNTITTSAGAHTVITGQKGSVSFNVPTTAAHVGAATSDHVHGNITNGGDITATAPTIASGDQIIINDHSASKITNGPTFDGSTTTKALTQKGTWESFQASLVSGTNIKTINSQSLLGSGNIEIAATTTSPKMDGTAAVGSETKWAKGDHVHPSDTSRVPTSRTVNGKALSSNITITDSDIQSNLEANTTVFSQLSDAFNLIDSKSKVQIIRW